MEISAYRSYSESDFEINFWRTKSGLEVDFILGRGEIAIEAKGSSRIDNKDIRPMKAFINEYKPKRAYIVCNEREERVHDNIRIIPYRKFLNNLWQNKIIR